MKKTCLYVLALVFVVLLQGCTNDEAVAPKHGSNQLRLIFNESVADGSNAVISISDLNGNPLVEDQEVILKKQMGEFAVVGIDLPQGDFVIEEFFVLSENEAVWASPRSGSAFAQNVSQPINTLKGDRSNVVHIELLPVNGAEASKFGYSSFRKAANPFKIAVYISENGKLVPTEATMMLYEIGGGHEYFYQLDPKLNTVSWPTYPSDIYQLIVAKPGYANYYYGHVSYEYLRSNGNKPLKIVLEPATQEDVFTFDFTGTSMNFQLGFRDSGSVVVNWGDGTIDSISFTPEPGSFPSSASTADLSHTYAADGPHQISITGDLYKI
jgi:hypothetical protein